MLVYSFKLPPPAGTPSYPRGRVVPLVFEDEGVQNISKIKIYRTVIIQKLFFYRVAGETYAELFENLLVYLA